MEIILEGQRFVPKDEPTIDPELGYRIDSLDYADSEAEGDAAFIEVRGRTPICKLVAEGTIYTDKPIWGKGTLIVKPYMRDVIVSHFDDIAFYEEDGTAMTPVYLYHPGDFYCWIADDPEEGIAVLGTSDPDYNKEQEAIYDLGDQKIPADMNEAVNTELAKRQK
jgi:hypothetical protein